MERIEDLLHRRTDLSTFVIDLTRDLEPPGKLAHDNLLSILRRQRLEARSVRGMGEKLAEFGPEIEDTQRVVCFTEIPLEHA